jgi:hypothetical protein
MAISEGLSATKAGFELVRGALELLKRQDVDRNEVTARLLELQGLILETQRALGDAEDENRGLRRRVDELTNVVEFGNDFEFEEGVYWKRNYPYCPNCWDAERKPTRLSGPYASSGPKSRWDCPLHKTIFHLLRKSPSS